MYKRFIIEDVKKAKKIYPAIFIIGPKKVGKTTFALDMAKNFYSFDDVTTYLSAKKDPYDFVLNLKTPCVIDEAQKIPKIFAFIEEKIEKNNKPDLKYIFTSSTDILKSISLGKSLKNGAFFEFLPFTLKEILSKKDKNLVDELFSKKFLERKYSYIPRDEIFRHIIKGGFPEALKIKKDIQRFMYYADYINDATLKNAIEAFELRNHDKFLHLLTILAKKSATVINKSDIYQTVQIDNKTLDTYLKFLEETYLISFVKHFRLFARKKIIKSPKLYFLDTGILCYLLGIKSIEELEKSPLLENIFNTFIFTEIFKHISYSESKINLSFYRTILKQEVNFVLNRENKNILINVKFSSTVLPQDFKNIKKVISADNTDDIGIVFYNGESVLKYNEIDNQSRMKDKYDNFFAVPISIFF